MSVSWRPALEGQPAGTDTDPATALVTAVRDAAVLLAESGGATIAEVVAELESHDWAVFRRLALFVLDAHGQDAAGLIGAHLTAPAAIRDVSLSREFLMLARHHCERISTRQRLVAEIGEAEDPATSTPVPVRDISFGSRCPQAIWRLRPSTDLKSPISGWYRSRCNANMLGAAGVRRKAADTIRDHCWQRPGFTLRSSVGVPLRARYVGGGQGPLRRRGQGSGLGLSVCCSLTQRASAADRPPGSQVTIRSRAGRVR
jgi:hypothetical protein